MRKIQLKNMYVFELNILQQKKDDNETSELATGEITSFEHGLSFIDGEPLNYRVEFYLSLKTTCLKSIELKYYADFETDIEVDEDFKSSGFALVNSPAIAYPYLRAYLTNLMTLSGFETVILPTVNFQGLFNKFKEQLKIDQEKTLDNQ